MDRGQSHLSLRIEGQPIAASHFCSGISSCLSLASAVSDSVAGRANSFSWYVEVEDGNRLVHYHPRAKSAPESHIPKALDAIVDGLRKIDSGCTQRPLHFSDRSLRMAMRLAALASRREVDSVEVLRPGDGCRLGPQSLAPLRRMLGLQRQESGTVEGRLQAISDRNGRLQFIVEDELTRRSVACLIAEDKLFEAMTAFRQRVAVFGDTRYRKDGSLLSIEVQSLSRFPPADRLPGIEDVRGIAN